MTEPRTRPHAISGTGRAAPAASIAVGLLIAGSVGAAPQQDALDALAQMSLEELGAMRVTSVARRETRLDRSPASIYVITAQDIRRSGATTLPEVLRLAPNLQVARKSSVDYAISARGFNNAVGNKLLVLIDGRTVYTPVYSGVFWEMQDTQLQDIERIEVISGPGATLWGANAVNGVINVITRSATETRGGLVSADLGTTERGAAVRHGGTIGDSGAWRLYARGREWDRTGGRNGFNPHDEWHRNQAGFRADWQPGADTLTLQGDVHAGRSEHRGFAGALELTPHRVSGHNLLGRWTRSLAQGGEFRLQGFLDQLEREELVIFQPDVRTVDIEFQHALPFGAHQFMWGGGYRRATDDVAPGFFSTFYPRSRRMEWFNLFVHHQLPLAPDVDLTLGLKLESNPFTDVEVLPNARLAWAPTEASMVWGSASRAVRSPSRYDRDVFFPQNPPHIVAGGPDFVSEVADVYELGYRAQPSAAISLSITAFRHEWDRLRSGTALPLPITFVNNIEGTVTGVEGWAHWQAHPRWRLSGGFLAMDKDLAFRAGTAEDTAGVDNSTLHNDPDYQWMLRSRADIGRNMELDLYLRGVDELTVEPVPSYVELDLRVGVRVSPSLDVSLVGRNLLDRRHGEYGAAPRRSEFERAAHLQVEWRY
jgi:iron complex outermembrane recepter protein